jgi:hypothetical protein
MRQHDQNKNRLRLLSNGNPVVSILPQGHYGKSSHAGHFLAIFSPLANRQVGPTRYLHTGRPMSALSSKPLPPIGTGLGLCQDLGKMTGHLVHKHLDHSDAEDLFKFRSDGCKETRDHEVLTAVATSYRGCQLRIDPPLTLGHGYLGDRS